MKNCGSSSYYPVMLDLAGKPCVIIGAGRVAERKAESLLKADAIVTVIGPSCTPQIEQWAAEGRVKLLKQPYRTGMQELREALLVFAATDLAIVNQSVRLEAEALGKLVSVADDTADSGFIVPAVVRRGKLTIAVSTAGASPAVARKVRRELEQAFGEEYATYLDLLQELRSQIRTMVPETDTRQSMYKTMLDWELLPGIRAGILDAKLRAELVKRIAAEPSVEGMRRIGDWIGETMDSIK